MDRYTQIKSFVHTAEQGSFSKAALMENVTPIIMARRVSALEKRLGITLLHRSTRGLTLTHLGEEFLQQCKDSVRHIEELEESMRSGKDDISGQLAITAPAGFGRLHVAPHVESFLVKYPKIRLTLNLTDQVIDMVKEGFDMGIRIGFDIDPNYVIRKLHPNHRVVCAAPAYFARHGRPEKPADLVAHNCLTFANHGGQSRGWTFRDRGKVITVRVTGNPTCNEGEMLYRWAKLGLGIVWRSTWEIQNDLKSGALVTVLESFAIPNYDIQAVYPQQPHLPQKIRSFIHHLHEIYNTAGYWEKTAWPNKNKYR